MKNKMLTVSIVSFILSILLIVINEAGFIIGTITSKPLNWTTPSLILFLISILVGIVVLYANINSVDNNMMSLNNKFMTKGIISCLIAQIIVILIGKITKINIATNSFSIDVIALATIIISIIADVLIILAIINVIKMIFNIIKKNSNK